MEEIFTNIKGRILQIAEFKGVSKEDFLSTLGQTYGNYKGKSKHSAPSSEVLVEISTKYPEINLNWVLTGEGEMLKSTPNDASFFQKHSDLKEENNRLKVLLADKILEIDSLLSQVRGFQKKQKQQVG